MQPLAFVITELNPGGAEACLVELATRINRQRFAPVVYSLAPPPRADRQSLVHRLTAAGVPTHFLGLTHWSHYRRGTRQLTDLLRQQSPSLVQTFLFHANVLGTRAALAASAPRVVTGIRVADPRWWRSAIERSATASADRHVCVSQSVREACRVRGFAAEKLVVIPNGIDIARWRNAVPADLSTFDIPHQAPVLLFVGRLDKQKGLDAFFHQLPKLFTALPDHHLLLIGDGPLAPRLKNLAHRYQLNGRVHFAGWQANVPVIMAVAQLLILPSRWEGMPNVVLEAMAAGKPVVATQAEGAVELLGLAAPDQTTAVGDWIAFRNRVIEIAKNPGLAADLAQRNRARAEQFSFDSAVDRYQRLYDAVLQG